jgi:hypothetical protein
MAIIKKNYIFEKKKIDFSKLLCFIINMKILNLKFFF